MLTNIILIRHIKLKILQLKLPLLRQYLKPSRLPT